MKKLLDFVKCFSLTIDTIMYFLSFILSIWYTSWLFLDVKQALNAGDKSHLVMLQIWFTFLGRIFVSIFMKVFYSNFLVMFLSDSDIWLLVATMNELWNIISFLLTKELVKNWYSSLNVCFTNEAIWVWAFPAGNLSKY